MKYLAAALELVRAERNTLTINFEDIERYNQQLAVTILEEYYRYLTFNMKLGIVPTHLCLLFLSS